MRDTQRKKLFQSKIGKAQKASNRRDYVCIQSGCKNKAIKSHSQQKMCQLDSIAENSFVYSVEKSLYQVFNDKPRELLVKKTITESSRYKGYCNYHDTKLFFDIENDNLDITNPQHNYLLLLRCVSYEYANKRDAYLRQQDILEYTGDLMSWDGRKGYEDSGLGLKQFLEIDAPYYFKQLELVESSGCYDLIEYKSFTINRNLGISSTTCFSPLRSKHSDWMLENYSQPQPFISLSVVPTEDKTHISFCWFKDFSEHCDEYRALNVDSDEVLKLINMYVFTESEDVCVTPSIWESLSASERHSIYRAIRDRDSNSSENEIPFIIGTQCT